MEDGGGRALRRLPVCSGEWQVDEDATCREEEHRKRRVFRGKIVSSVSGVLRMRCLLDIETELPCRQLEERRSVGRSGLRIRSCESPAV